MRTGLSPADIAAAQVIFEVTPTLQENGTVEYSAITPVHLPGGIQVYRRTNSRTFSISAKLVSRNAEDAAKNMRYLQNLRSWRYPFFGATDTKLAALAPQSSGEKPVESADKAAISRVKDDTAQLRGAPPEVLYLYGYTAGDNSTNAQFKFENLNRVPVVLASLDITYPDDVDYIPVMSSDKKNIVPFPIKMDVTISLLETHSPREYEQFDLVAYKQGKLVGF